MKNKSKITIRSGKIIMLKRVCDKCKKSLEDEAYYEMDFYKIDKDGWRASSKSFDFCKDCYKEFLDSLKENK